MFNCGCFIMLTLSGFDVLFFIPAIAFPFLWYGYVISSTGPQGRRSSIKDMIHARRQSLSAQLNGLPFVE